MRAIHNNDLMESHTSYDGDIDPNITHISPVINFIEIFIGIFFFDKNKQTNKYIDVLLSYSYYFISCGCQNIILSLGDKRYV